MIPRVHPSVQSHLIAVHRAARAEGADNALEMLRSSNRPPAQSTYDDVAMALLASEICYLDYRYADALRTFDEQLDPLLTSIDPKIATIIADNKATVLMSTFHPSGTKRFYALVDARRILGLHLRDSSSLLDAIEYVSEGKHFRALPLYWQQLQSAYRTQNWRSLAAAEKDFATECIHLLWLPEAALHAMLSRNSELIAPLSASILKQRSAQVVHASLMNLLSRSSLKAHASQVALFLEAISDVIPAEDFAQVIAWLDRWCDFIPTGWSDTPLFERVWSAIRAASPRMSAHEASSFVDQATSHPAMQGGRGRSFLVTAITSLSARLTQEQRFGLLELATSLVQARKQDWDYKECINLIYALDHFGGAPIRAHLRRLLFADRLGTSDTLLIRLAAHLGCSPADPTAFQAMVPTVATSIKNQVQALSPNEEPHMIGGFGCMTLAGPQGKKVVHIVGASREVDVLVAYRQHISSENIQALVDAMLEMIRCPNNLVQNRVGLIHQLSQLLDLVSTDQFGLVRDALEPLASGQISDGELGQAFAGASDPLNRIQISTGDPADLRGFALRALAKLNKLKRGTVSNMHNVLLPFSLVDANPRVRQHALLASEDEPDLSASERHLIALASLDRDPTVAALALRVLNEAIGGLEPDTMLWHVLIRSIELAEESEDLDHRGMAAQVLKALSTFSIPVELQQRFASARALFCSDISFSVRQCLMSD